MTLEARLQKHLAVAAVAAAGIVGASHGAIIYQFVNISIPDNIDGIYLNVVALQQATAAFTGYDINPYSAGATGTGTLFNLWGPSANTWFAVGGANGNYNLTPSVTIQGDASAFFRPGNFNLAPQMNLNSSQNVLGFRFVNEANGNQVHFGWMRVQFGANYGIRTILDIAYESQANVGISAGFIPAPAAGVLLALGGVARRCRRRLG